MRGDKKRKRKKRILIVDDEELVLKTLSQALRREGMEVLAPFLQSAVALIIDETPLNGLCTPQ